MASRTDIGGDETHWAELRRAMVRTQIAGRDVTDPRVLQAMAEVPRHELVPPRLRSMAYHDSPLPIGRGQTISQPYIVAKMTELAGISPGNKVLEIGTGSGYQSAVLAEVGAFVYSIEIMADLAASASQTLTELGYDVIVRTGDGYQGWPEEAPFDAIVVTAAPLHVPPPLIEQLALGGRMVIPVGELRQDLMLITKDRQGLTREMVLPVRFVPMTGEALKVGGEGR